MDNPYIDYYMNQAGTGIASYAGHRYQAGNGIFGKIFKKLKPALKYVANKGWEAFNGVGNDVLSGNTIKEAGTKQLLRTADSILADVKTKINNAKQQKGMGRKRKRRQSVKTLTKKIKSARTSKKTYRRRKKRKVVKKY